ncbi:MAG: LptF/LptG family permease, partial [Planctomycetes bacterium]|nr:LptF/LptG family permease [Planctomycetota bacterium]
MVTTHHSLFTPLFTMYIIDRYILRMFIKVLLVSFISLAGLFIVIDAFNNLEEFISYGEEQGSTLAVLCDYYGARLLTFFDTTSALLAMIAAIFVVVWMQSSNELTAVEAAGVSKIRIIKPLVLAVIAVSLLAVEGELIGMRSCGI